MDTPIGLQLRSPRSRAILAGLIAATVVTADLLPVWDLWVARVRVFLPLAGALALLTASGWDRGSLGLRWTPVHGWGRWLRLILGIGVIVGGVSLILLAVGRWMGYAIPIEPLPPAWVPEQFWRMCILAPLLEETTYRLVLCTAAAAVLGAWPAVVLSGLVFGYLHIRYGCAAPTNLVAGFFLGWAYLRSSSIAVPILMHALGNLCVLLLQLAVWCRQASLS